MSGRIYLCDVADVLDEGRKRVLPAGRAPIGVFSVGDSLYAIDDTCSHGNASLCDGDVDLDDGVVFCPFHGGGFDLRTGAAVHPPCVRPVSIWPIAVADGKIYLDEDGG